jgi:hypothetical protein
MMVLSIRPPRQRRILTADRRSSSSALMDSPLPAWQWVMMTSPAGFWSLALSCPAARPGPTGSAPPHQTTLEDRGDAWNVPRQWGETIQSSSWILPPQLRCADCNPSAHESQIPVGVMQLALLGGRRLVVGKLGGDSADHRQTAHVPQTNIVF